MNEHKLQKRKLNYIRVYLDLVVRYRGLDTIFIPPIKEPLDLSGGDFKIFDEHKAVLRRKIDTGLNIITEDTSEIYILYSMNIKYQDERIISFYIRDLPRYSGEFLEKKNKHHLRYFLMENYNMIAKNTKEEIMKILEDDTYLEPMEALIIKTKIKEKNG